MDEGAARAFNSEHQMELINECSARFAEDKDFRLLVGPSLHLSVGEADLSLDRRQHNGALSC
jgi:hypothetical protein